MSEVILTPEFFDRDPAETARALLGKALCRRTPEGLTSGRIVETEAYLAEDDPACHANRGQTPRNAMMFGPPGRAYVYSIHARYCFNIVTEPTDRASAVLIRAIEPLEGLDLMHKRRQREKPVELTNGPAKLCEALAIDREQNGLLLSEAENLWIADDGPAVKTPTVMCSPRIGISAAQDLLLRFFWAENQFVSGTKKNARPVE